MHLCVSAYCQPCRHGDDIMAHSLPLSSLQMGREERWRDRATDKGCGGVKRRRSEMRDTYREEVREGLEVSWKREENINLNRYFLNFV